MEVIDDIFAPWLGYVTETRREADLQAHHRQARVAERDRELGPEVARGRPRPGQQREQRGEDEQKINRNPDRTVHRIAEAHEPYPPQYASPPAKQGRS